MKHISYLLAATLAVAFLTSRQGCAQDATKLVPTEPAPATSAAPVKTHPAHGEANVQRLHVAPFEIQKDVTFPPEYLALMQTEISEELTRKFLPKLPPRVRRLRPMLTYCVLPG